MKVAHMGVLCIINTRKCKHARIERQHPMHGLCVSGTAAVLSGNADPQTDCYDCPSGYYSKGHAANNCSLAKVVCCGTRHADLVDDVRVYACYALSCPNKCTIHSYFHPLITIHSSAFIRQFIHLSIHTSTRTHTLMHPIIRPFISVSRRRRDATEIK